MGPIRLMGPMGWEEGFALGLRNEIRIRFEGGDPVGE